MTHTKRASIDVHASLRQALRSWSEFAARSLGQSEVTFAPLAVGRARVTVEVANDPAQGHDDAGGRALERDLRAFKLYAEKSARERRAGDAMRGERKRSRRPPSHGAEARRRA